MSRHKFTVTVHVSDEILAEHDSEHKPPPKEIDDWDFRDIAAAIDEGIVDAHESDVDSYDGEATEE